MTFYNVRHRVQPGSAIDNNHAESNEKVFYLETREKKDLRTQNVKAIQTTSEENQRRVGYTSKFAQFSQHFRVLMWKNYILRIRHVPFLAFELIMPCLIVLVMALVRLQASLSKEPNCHMPAQNMPSMGLYRLLQSELCNPSFQCQNFDQAKFDNPSMDKATKKMVRAVYTLQQSEFVTTTVQSGNLDGLSDPTVGVVPLYADAIVSVAEFIKNLSFTQASICTDTKMPGADLCAALNTSQMRVLFGAEVGYFPDTVYTKDLIRLVTEGLFGSIQNFKTLFTNWPATKRQLESTLSGTIFNSLVTKLNDCARQNLNTNCDPAAKYLTVPKPVIPGHVGHWTDSITQIDQAINQWNQIMNCLPTAQKFTPFQTEAAFNLFLHSIADNKDSNKVGLLFDTVPTDSNKILSMQIRMHGANVPETNHFIVLDRYWIPGSVQMGYFTSGFIYLQDLISQAVVNSTGFDKIPYAIQMKMFPQPCYLKDSTAQFLGIAISQLLMPTWVITIILTVKFMVDEKETRIKEFTKVMGVSSLAHWASWFAIGLLIMFPVSVVMSVIMKYGRVLSFSQFSVILFVFFSMAIATIAQIFLFAAIFTRATMGAVVSALIYFALYLPVPLAIKNEDLVANWLVVLACLFSETAYGFSMLRLARLDWQGVGAQWNNLWNPTVMDNLPTVGLGLVMLWVDTFIYLVLAWYIENVFPGKYGIPQPFYFLFTKSYWMGPSKTVSSKSNAVSNQPENEVEDEELDQHVVRSRFEPDPIGMDVGVSVHKLVKVYKKGAPPAVNGLSVNFFEGQITSFLGHNGAGKSTTMSILIGLYPPTSGTATIKGYDLRTQLTLVRKHLGFCPQHNILFNYMSVEEHISFYAQLKGLSRKEAKADVQMLLDMLGFPEKAKERSGNLSGGQKRKLSVAMAFVGGSPVVLLDEPTAGVDPHSRRSIWDLVLRMKPGRTIILTTHHMDEADILGDRIAVVSQGKLRCCGSSLFLREHYSQGYSLVFALKDGKDSGDPNSPPVNVDRVTAFLRRFIPEARLVSQSLNELTYTLPPEGALDGQFSKFFWHLESTAASNRTQISPDLSQFGIIGFGLSDTTLEEIFLHVADDPAKRSDGQVPAQATRDSLTNRSLIGVNLTSTEDPSLSKQSQRVSGIRHVGQQFRAMFCKRMHYMKRDKRGWITQYLVPVIVVILAVGLIVLLTYTQGFPGMPLHPWLYSARHVDVPLQSFFSVHPTDLCPQVEHPLNEQQTALQLAKQFQSALTSLNGWTGTRCIPETDYSFIPTNVRGCQAIDRTDLKALPTDALMLASASGAVHCNCTHTGFQICPCQAVRPYPPPSFISQTTDVVYNLTGYNTSDFLLKTFLDSLRKRFGGVAFTMSESDAERYRLNHLIQPNSALLAYLNHLTKSPQPTTFWNEAAAFLRSILPPTAYLQVWYNGDGYASAPAYHNLVENLLLRLQQPSGTDASRIGIAVVNAPLTLPITTSDSERTLQQVIDGALAAFVVLGLAFVPSSFITFLVEERQTGAKHLQLSSGLNPIVYWTTNLLWDLLTYLLPAILCVLVFVAYQMKAFVGQDTVGIFILLMILFGFAVTPMMYPASFFIKSPSSAFVIMAVVNLGLGAGTVFLMLLLDIVSATNTSIVSVKNGLNIFFLLFPQYCLGGALYDLSKRHYDVTHGYPVEQNLFSWNALGKNVIFLIVETFLFFGFVLLLEYQFFFFEVQAYFHRKYPSLKQKNRRKKEKRLAWADLMDPQELDEDVQQEKQRVLNTPTESETLDTIRAVELTKFFGRKRYPSVRRLTFAVRPSECFGLLGVNGAGKTTTFRMLTGAIRPSLGDAQVCGYNVITQKKLTRQNIGFCPQFDALHDKLTGRETLIMYARLRGIPESDISDLVDENLENMSLSPHARKITEAYSGGNKRKLSAAIAMLGGPQVIFLDEPTSGMDPVGKRFLWQRILELLKQKRTLVMTSHSMEECEALCSRIGIMVAGQFRCMGSVQHLKNLYGSGYTMDVRLLPSGKSSEEISNLIQAEFPVTKASNLDTMSHEYQFPANVSLSRLFTTMGQMVHDRYVESFSVRQTSLDQVFVNFARKQQSNDDSDDEENEFNMPAQQRQT